MFCNNCGNELSDAAAICPKCGVPVAGRNFATNAAIPNHMVGAVLTTIFCCLIGGIVAIIYASQVNSKLALGDIEGAKAASKTAQGWIIANVVVGLVGGILYALLGAVGSAL